MRCNTCGAWTTLLSASTTEPYVTRRDYICENDHRFYSLEALPPGVPARERRIAARAAEDDVTRWRRNQAITKALLAGGTTAAVADHYGLTEARVRQIRDTMCSQGPTP